MAVAALDAAIHGAVAELAAARSHEETVRGALVRDARPVRWEALPEHERDALLGKGPRRSAAFSDAGVPLGHRAAAVAEAMRAVEDAAEGAAGLRARLRGPLTTAARAMHHIAVLHAALSRSEKALERVEDVVELRSCTADIARSLSRGEAEAAALAIQRFHGVAKTLPVAPEDRERVREAEKQVVAETRASLRRAMESGDEEAVSTGCRVLAVLGRGAEGVVLFASRLRERLRAGLPAAVAAACGVESADPAALALGAPPVVGSAALLGARDAELVAAWAAWYARTGAGAAVAGSAVRAVNAASAAFAAAIREVQGAGAVVTAAFDEPGPGDDEGGSDWAVRTGVRGEGSRLVAGAAAVEAAAAAAAAIAAVAGSEGVMSLVGARSAVQEAVRDAASTAGAGLHPCLAFAQAATEDGATEDEGGAGGCVWVDLARRLGPSDPTDGGSPLERLGSALDGLSLALRRATRFRSLLLGRVAGASGAAGPGPAGAAWSLRFVESQCGPLVRACNDCASMASTLERLQLEVGLARVAAVEAPEGVEPARTSLVEDAVWVVRQSLARASSTGEPAVLGTVAKASAEAWAQGLRGGLQLRVEAALGKRQQGMPARAPRHGAAGAGAKGAGPGTPGRRGGGHGAVSAAAGAGAATPTRSSTMGAMAAAAASVWQSPGAQSAAEALPLAETGDDVVTCVREHLWVLADGALAARAAERAGDEADGEGEEGGAGGDEDDGAGALDDAVALHCALRRASSEQVAAAAAINAVYEAEEAAAGLAAWVRAQAGDGDGSLHLLMRASLDSGKAAVSPVEHAARALDDAAAAMAELRRSAIARLCAAMSPALRSATIPLAGAAAQVRYDDDAAPSSAEDSVASSAFASGVLGALARALAPWRALLRPAAAQDCVCTVARFVCGRVLDTALRRDVTGSGAVRLDRDARLLAATLERMGGLKARTHASSLLQAARILCCDSVEEAAEEWALDGERLGQDRAAAIIRRRADMAGAADSARVAAALSAAAAVAGAATSDSQR